MSTETPEELRDFWLTREGSQKGQYGLGYHEVGVLFQRIGDLETRLAEYERHRIHMSTCRVAADSKAYTRLDVELMTAVCLAMHEHKLEQELKDLRELIPRPDSEATSAVSALKDKNALVLYFGDDVTRQEFAAAITAAMHNVRTVRL